MTIRYGPELLDALDSAVRQPFVGTAWRHMFNGYNRWDLTSANGKMVLMVISRTTILGLSSLRPVSALIATPRLEPVAS